MKAYKLLSQDLKSYNDNQWEIGKTITIDVLGKEMCTNQVLHYYNHPILAIILNSIHANIKNPRLFEIEIDDQVNTDGLKFASKSQTLIKEIPIPEISIDQRIEIAIRITKTVCFDEQWNKWADNWLNGSDRSKESAYAAAAAYAVAHAAAVAAAVAAAYAADAAAADYNAAYAAAHAAAVNSVANNTVKFNQKLIEIVEMVMEK